MKVAAKLPKTGLPVLGGAAVDGQGQCGQVF
jgi:hypothetical protein